MSELNIFLSALQSAFATSVQQAVAAATAPLVERIAALEKNEEYLTRRITALEGDISHKVQVQQANIVAALADRIAALEEKVNFLEDQAVVTSNATDTRITALENNPAIGVDTTLEKRVAVLEGSHQMSADAFVTHLDKQEWFWEKLQNRIDAAAEAAMDDHLGTYDHDEYDNHINDDDKHFDGDIEDAVRDALNGTSVTLSF